MPFLTCPHTHEQSTSFSTSAVSLVIQVTTLISQKSAFTAQISLFLIIVFFFFAYTVSEHKEGGRRTWVQLFVDDKINDRGVKLLIVGFKE